MSDNIEKRFAEIDRDEEAALLVETMKEFVHQGAVLPNPLFDKALVITQSIAMQDDNMKERGWR